MVSRWPVWLDCPRNCWGRASKILDELESQEPVEKDIVPKMEAIQMTLFDQAESDEVRDKLREIDINGITPLQALSILSELKDLSD